MKAVLCKTHGPPETLAVEELPAPTPGPAAGPPEPPMKAVLSKPHGPPETLAVEELPDPTPGPGEVVVDVAFASLNFFDTLIIENKYQLKPALPFSPGGELSGRVAAVGE